MNGREHIENVESGIKGSWERSRASGVCEGWGCACKFQWSPQLMHRKIDADTVGPTGTRVTSDTGRKSGRP